MAGRTGCRRGRRQRRRRATSLCGTCGGPRSSPEKSEGAAHARRCGDLRGLQRAGAAARFSELPRYDADGDAAPNLPGGGARGACRWADIDRCNRCRLPVHQSRPLRAAVQRSVRAIPIRAPAGARSTHRLTGKAAPQPTTTELPTILLSAAGASADYRGLVLVRVVRRRFAIRAIRALTCCSSKLFGSKSPNQSLTS